MSAVLEQVANWLWGAPLLVVLLGGGLCFAAYSRLAPLRYLRHAVGFRDTRQFFFDLADPAKRSREDLLGALRAFSRYQAHAEVTLGLNFNEALQVTEVLGLEQREEDETGLRKMAAEIRNELELACVVVHPVTSAACATKDGDWWALGPYVSQPKITTGAGDHFNAGFCAARLCGFSPRSCLTLATCTSGYYVRTAQSPSPSQVVGLLREVSR